MLALIACLISSPQHLVNLFARLANDNIGYVDWTPYIPTVSHQRGLCASESMSVNVFIGDFWFMRIRVSSGEVGQMCIVTI